MFDLLFAVADRWGLHPVIDCLDTIGDGDGGSGGQEGGAVGLKVVILNCNKVVGR